MVSIALVSEHKLIIHAIKQMIHQREKEFTVITKAYSGLEFIKYLQENILPDIAFIDIHMPGMDGLSITQYICKKHPSVKVIGLSATYDEEMIKKMSFAGAVGMVAKNDAVSVFWEALYTVSNNNTYFYKQYKWHKKDSIHPNKNNKSIPLLSDKEKEFLRLCATELTYKEIASQMHVKTRTVENYRISLFEKLNVVSRQGLVLFAVLNGYLEVSTGIIEHP